MNLADSVLQEVWAAEVVHVVWKRIIELYEDKKVARILNLEHNLYTLEYSKFNSIIRLTKKMQKVWDDLVTIGSIATTQHMASHILFKLPIRKHAFFKLGRPYTLGKGASLSHGD